jgi:hypothetical protein
MDDDVAGDLVRTAVREIAREGCGPIGVAPARRSSVSTSLRSAAQICAVIQPLAVYRRLPRGFAPRGKVTEPSSARPTHDTSRHCPISPPSLPDVTALSWRSQASSIKCHGAVVDESDLHASAETPVSTWTPSARSTSANASISGSACSRGPASFEARSSSPLTLAIGSTRELGTNSVRLSESSDDRARPEAACHVAACLTWCALGGPALLTSAARARGSRRLSLSAAIPLPCSPRLRPSPEVQRPRPGDQSRRWRSRQSARS